MLVGSASVLSALLISCLLHQAGTLNAFSGQFALYSNAQNAASFAEMANATMPRNESGCSAWLDALNLSAKEDGIAIKVANGTIAISTITAPKAYAVIRLNI